MARGVLTYRATVTAVHGAGADRRADLEVEMARADGVTHLRGTATVVAA